ncbi:MAG: TatD family hydrolase [Myxococcota bacterium]
MGLFDVHAHLTDERLAAREDEILAAARAAGVTTILSNGLNPTDNQATAELAARSGGLVKPCFGFYPVDTVLPEMLAAGIDYPHREVEHLPTVDEGVAWVRENLDACVAVGEIGLDGYWIPEELWPQQERAFRAMVSLAMEADKPIIFHSRKLEQRAMDILVEMGATRVDWHCYGSKIKRAMRIAALPGHYLSIPANCARVPGFRAMLERLPRDRVLLETDCPYLSPDRGELNHPANVARTVTLAAELWSCSEDAVLAQLEENFERLFGFAP